jgi:hypothetical protein
LNSQEALAYFFQSFMEMYGGDLAQGQEPVTMENFDEIL